MAVITNDMIAPELRKKGGIIRTFMPYFKESTFRMSKAGMGLMKGRCGKGMRYEQVYVERPKGGAMQGQLRLCVYSPIEPGAPAPGVVWIHGGGYAIGIPEQDESFIRDFVTRHNCTVVAPDYCLSVNSPYPAALEDCYLALLWLKEHADELGVSSRQLFVGGDSAGGGLTAALTIYARDRGEVAIAYQMPLYPMLDDRATESSMDNDAPVWNTKSNETAWKIYLADLYRTDSVPAYAAPARLEDFSGLPPAFTFVGSIEPFLDETLAYIERLKAAGIQAECHVFEGCYHGFDILAAKSPQAREAHRLLAASFDCAVANFFAEQPQETKLQP